MTALHGTASVNSQQLYRLFDADGELLYIGISYSAISRFAQHKARQPWIGDVCRIEIETHEVGRDEILEIERAAIISERPKHNKTHIAKPEQAVTGGERIGEYDMSALGRSHVLHETYVALDRLANEIARDERIDDFTVADFGNLAHHVAHGVRYADCCDQCGHINYPYRVKRDSPTWITGFYICDGCWFHQWTCGWAG